MRRLLLACCVVSVFALPLKAADPWLEVAGGDGPGKGKKVVLVSGDEEYRSEEALPQLVAMRTATHAFNIPEGRAYRRWSWDNGGEGFAQGFGRQVLGETWISHHGGHGSESTRGLLAPDAKDHPILRGIKDGEVWGPTDVYGVRLPLPGDSKPLVLGAVLAGMKPDSPPVAGEKNEPMMPVAWTKSYSVEGGPKGRSFTTTMGAATDMTAEGTRRMLVNACYWAAGLEAKIPEKSKVDIVGTFEPTPFGFNGAKKGLSPADYR